MNIRVVFLLFFTCFFSQKIISGDIILKKIYTTSKTNDISYPFMLDSINMKGKKYEKKDLLESFISFPNPSVFSDEITTDLAGYFLLSKARQGDGRIYLLSFNLNVDKYAKTNMKIIAPSMFEAYINGVKEGTKTSIEDTLTSAKTTKLSFPTSPGAYNILIKYLSFADNKNREGIKIVVESEDVHSTVNYTFSQPDEKHRITIKDILVGTRVVSTELSASGQYTILTYATVRSDGKSITTKELYDRKTERRVVLSDKNYTWMPSSDRLYYTESSQGVVKLFVVDPETLTEKLLADNIPTGSFTMASNESLLIFSDQEKNEDSKSDLMILTRPESRQPNDGDRHFLSKYDLSTGVKQRLTFGKESTELEDISYDSRYILYSVSSYTPTIRPFYRQSMYRMNLETMGAELLWENEGFTSSALFSPDGKNLLITGSAEAFGGVGNTVKTGSIPNSYNNLAFIMDLSTGSVDAFTKNFLPSVSDSYWNPTDGMIYLKVTDKDYERIYRYDPSRRNFKQLLLKEDVIRKISYASKSAYATYYGVGASNSTRAYVVNLRNDQVLKIADPYRREQDKLELGPVNDWSFRASDGTVVDGRYYLPPNFDSTKKYPMIVYYYGGTMPTPRTMESPYPSHVYAALGYVVYVLQPSGTIGYGQEFAARHVNGWGKRNAQDIIEGTEQFLKEHSFVDDKKVGCIGASYGGYMTMYLQTQTDLFAAAVSHAGISSLSSYWGEGYWGYTYSAGASAGSYPWNNKELYIEQSPLFNADKVKTPILLLHGTEDTNVPIGESVQMYTALKILGKPVELIQVKGENHGIRDFKRKIEWNQSIYAWFAKWLQNDSAWWDSIYEPK